MDVPQDEEWPHLMRNRTESQFAIKRYQPEDAPEVAHFNSRLQAAGSQLGFPESAVPFWLPEGEGRRIFQEYYVASENGVIRGAYIIKHQDFLIMDRVRSIGDYSLPISEGIVDQAFNHVGLRLLVDAIERQPLLYALGMGGTDEPLPRLLKAFGWELCIVPFFIKVLHPTPFLRNAIPLRSSTLRRLAMDFLAISGTGWLGIHLLNALKYRGQSIDRGTRIEPVPDFGAWADQLWQESQKDYAFVAVRDSASLNILYPPSNPRFIRLRVMSNERVLGWAVVLDTRMQDHKQFGNMRIGSIIDCMALSANAKQIILAATRFLEQRGVDLILSNQSHTSWREAFKDSGYMKGPSNFAFAASKGLAELSDPFKINLSRFHITRGDGDGPIHL